MSAMPFFLVLLTFLSHLPASAMIGANGELHIRPGAEQRMSRNVGDLAFTIDLPSAGAAAKGMEFDGGLIRESQVKTFSTHTYSWKLQKLQGPGSAAEGVLGQFPVKIFLQKKDLFGKVIAEEELAEWAHDSGAIIDKRRVLVQITFSTDLESKLDRLDVITLPHDIKAKIEFILNNDGVLMGTLASRLDIGELPDYFLDKAFTSETVASYRETPEFVRLERAGADSIKQGKKDELFADLLKHGRFLLAAGTVEEAAHLDSLYASEIGGSHKKDWRRSFSCLCNCVLRFLAGV